MNRMTQGIGLGSGIAGVAVLVATALGAFDGQSPSVAIAAIALVAVALVVAGHVAVTDLRVRGERTAELRRSFPVEQNGHAPRGSEAGPPTCVLVRPRSGDLEVELFEQW